MRPGFSSRASWAGDSPRAFRRVDHRKSGSCSALGRSLPRQGKTVTKTFPNGIVLKEVADGLLVTQWDEAYLAKRWTLSDHVVELVEAAISAGLRWMIRERHPQTSRRWPSQTGTVYIAFSPTRENQWSFAIDTIKPTGDYGHCVFNGKYRDQFLSRRLPFRFEARNKGAGHLVVDRPDVIHTIRSLKGMDHSVLHLGRTASAVGFQTEYDIQRQLIANWDSTPFGASCELIGDEVPIDRGMTPRRIDILARDRGSGVLIVIELKRGEPAEAALTQVLGYVEALTSSCRFGGSPACAVLIAERLGSVVREAAAAAGVIGYEIEWPATLRRVC